MNTKLNSILVCVIIFFLVSCTSQPAEVEEEPGVVIPTITISDESDNTENRFSAPGMIMQWAVAAQASSEFSDPEWSAEQALGRPDSPGCGDYQFAWASAASDAIDTIVLEYSTSVFPLEIVIYESFNPDQVTKIEVFNAETGGFYTVLQQNPTQVDRPCPYELVVPVDGIDFLTNQIRVTVDQSQLGLGWNEIDAVQLIGSLDQP